MSKMITPGNFQAAPKKVKKFKTVVTFLLLPKSIFGIW